jgi:hypothetical protein
MTKAAIYFKVDEELKRKLQMKLLENGSIKISEFLTEKIKDYLEE